VIKRISETLDRRLRFILELLTLKAKHSWSDGSFNDPLRILAWLLPKSSKMPANTYRVKKLVSPFTMGVERIHAWLNHCILYRGDTFKDLDKCPICFPVDTKQCRLLWWRQSRSSRWVKKRGKVQLIVLPLLSQHTLLQVSLRSRAEFLP
jgi:hypothetical protein